MSAVAAPPRAGAVDRHAAAAELDRRLGDPRDPDNPLGFAAAADRDRRGAFPNALAAAARDGGLHLSYLPARWGGTLTGYDRTLMLARVAARRDLAVMPATMFSISALTSLIAGDCDEHVERAAAIVRDGGAVGYALSEEEAGSDLLACACRLEEVDGELRLSGRKWMVGLGDRCDALYVLARTGERGPGAFTALLLDRAALPGDRAVALEPEPVDGMRGIDFASFDFRDCPVGADAVAGRRGRGLEAAMKAQQVVRMMSAAGCLATADTALRVALDFAHAREVAGAPLLEQPAARAELARAFAALAAADAVALVAARAIHVWPERFSVMSGVVKRIATDLGDAAIGHAGAVLGARGLLASGPAGVFQKMRRDAAVVRYIDTSPVGNLRAIAMQLPLLARRHGGGAAEPDAERAERAATAFALGAELPEARPQALRLHASGHDDALGELAACRDELLGALDGAARGAAQSVLDELDALWARLDGAAGAADAGALEAAESFCHLYAAAACLLLWWHNRDEPLYGAEPGSQAWLRAALAYLLARAGGASAPPAEHLEGALETALALHSGERLLSAVPIALAQTTER